jgi:tRNA1(Val) A37 N6-methylase TrmN6
LAVVCADLGAAPFAAGGFDHAMTNPPYRGQGTRSPDRRRADARHETTLSLADWVVAAARLVRRGGTLTTVFTAARLAELTTALAPFAGDLTILPLWSRSTGPAEIVLVRAVRGGAERVIHLRPLVVHRDDGRFSAAAEGVLRGGQGLSLAEAMARP